MEITESIYEGVVKLSYKNLPGNTPTVLVTVDKKEYNPIRDGLALIRVRALESV